LPLNFHAKKLIFQARRRVVEACHSWFNRFRKLVIRYEKPDETHLALTHSAAAIIALRKIGFIFPFACPVSGRRRLVLGEKILYVVLPNAEAGKNRT
jgi:hypothetical protein